MQQRCVAQPRTKLKPAMCRTALEPAIPCHTTFGKRFVFDSGRHAEARTARVTDRFDSPWESVNCYVRFTSTEFTVRIVAAVLVWRTDGRHREQPEYYRVGCVRF